MGFYGNLRNSLQNTGSALASALLGQQANSTPPTQANEALTNYQDYLRQNGYSDNVINGIPQGLNSGDKNIADWINQYNNGAGKQTPIRIPQTQEEIGLAKQGLYNAPQLQGSASVSPRTGGILPDLISGYKENYSNGLSPNNWGNNTLPDGRTKGFAYRTGELLGSLGKIVDSPVGRGLIAYGLNNALGYDDSLKEGLTAFVGRENNMSADRLYRDALQKQGIDTSHIRGIVSKDMYNNVTKATTNAQKAQNQLTIASLKDNTSRARLIGNWLRSGTITPAEASTLAAAYGITDADFQVSNETRKTDSQIGLNNAKIENINNPKPRVNISYRYGKTDVNHNHTSNGGTSTNKGNNKPIGASNNSGKVRMRYQGKLYNVDANRVNEYIKAGGEVVK